MYQDVEKRDPHLNDCESSCQPRNSRSGSGGCSRQLLEAVDMVSFVTCFVWILTLTSVAGKPVEYQSASLQAMPPGIFLIPIFEKPSQDPGTVFNLSNLSPRIDSSPAQVFVGDARIKTGNERIIRSGDVGYRCVDLGDRAFLVQGFDAA
ncbi:unnamed protein product, partial [Iphiclides podalirius]